MYNNNNVHKRTVHMWVHEFSLDNQFTFAWQRGLFCCHQKPNGWYMWNREIPILYHGKIPDEQNWQRITSISCCPPTGNLNCAYTVQISTSFITRKQKRIIKKKPHKKMGPEKSKSCVRYSIVHIRVSWQDGVKLHHREGRNVITRRNKNSYNKNSVE